MKKIFLLIFIPLLAACHGHSGHWKLPEEELENLDAAIKDAPRYTEAFDLKLDSIKRSLPGLSDSRTRVNTLLRIARMYRQSKADSALHYANLAIQTAEIEGDAENLYRAKLTLCNALVASGLFSQATLLYDSLGSEAASRESRIDYFITGRRLYSNISSYIDERGYMAEVYKSKYEECDDSLIRLMPKDDILRKFIIGERMVSTGRFSAAREQLEGLLDSLDIRGSIYGMTAYQLAKAYKSEGDMYSYAFYLAKAAESDIVRNAREGYALPALATLFYDEGDFATAFHYINFALGDAYKGNARVRMVSMARLVPKIDEAYRRQISASRMDWIIFAGIASLLIVALGVVTFFLLKQRRRSRTSRLALAASSRMKDSYIGNFIGLCSTYSEKYNSLVKLVDRKLSSGQGAELLKTIRGGKFGEEENEVFYNEIDSVVLSLYPDFVEKINALLRPEERIEIKDGKLTPELRIYAFVRLGVSESVRIAKILNYSNNTVYAYRNRMRNRAIDRDNFDENVLKIGLE